MELQSGRYTPPAPPPAPLPVRGGSGAPPDDQHPRNGSPNSVGMRSTVSSDGAEYSESARLVHSSALSDDGMTPLIQVSHWAGKRAASLPALPHAAGQCCEAGNVSSRLT